MKRLVDLYPYRQDGNNIEFLILKRAPDVVYAGQWRVVAGKAEKNEAYHEAALRELKEETGALPNLFWTIPSLNQFYDHVTDQLYNIPAFAARIRKGQNITLNHEHESYEWISPKEIREYIGWPEQRRLIELLHSIVINNEILEEWIINGTN